MTDDDVRAFYQALLDSDGIYGDFGCYTDDPVDGFWVDTQGHYIVAALIKAGWTYPGRKEDEECSS